MILCTERMLKPAGMALLTILLLYDFIVITILQGEIMINISMLDNSNTRKVQIQMQLFLESTFPELISKVKLDQNNHSNA